MKAGSLLGGRFAVESLARTGGAGAVYRARDNQSARTIAIKVMHREGSVGAARFEREAELLSRLSHPAIVRYVAHGRTGEGEPWLAMEWLEGKELGDHLADHGALPVSAALTLGLRVASALGVAHRHGVVHRDIKPSNIFLPEGRLDRAKVLDFGVAGFTRASRLTQTGVPIGTPGYMAPEQARGERFVDARADIFALGCVLQECLTGEPTFVGQHWMAVLAKILFEDAPDVIDLRSDVPHGFSRLLRAMLAKDPDGRPADGDEVARRLGRLEVEPNRTPVSTLPPALTSAEQRLVSVVAAAEPRGEGGRKRLEEEVDMDQASAAFGVQVERLADGTHVALVSGAGTGAELASRATRCARAMLDAAPHMCAAVATGRGLVAERLPVGEVIDRVVPLLRRHGEPGRVLVDEVTRDLVEARFEVEGAGEEATHGVLGSERPWTVARRTLLGRPSPFVGRQRELGLLGATWTACVEEPSACAVIVTGAAGVGKSRLRHQFVAAARDHVGGEVGLLTGRGDPVGGGSAFTLVASALRGVMEVGSGTSFEEQREAVHAFLASRLSGETLARVSEFLSVLIGVGSSSGGSVQLEAARDDARLMGDQIRAAFVSWLEAECTVHPVLLVLEDAQWGDLPSMQLASDALRALRDAPFMVLALGRPEFHDRFVNPLRDRDLTEIRLSGLSVRAASELVQRVLGEDTPESHVSQMVAQAEGNALYLEELIRARAKGVEDSLPPTVFGLLQARLDALDPEARRVLRAASVFGRRFSAEGVQALLEGVPSVGEWFEMLVEQEVLLRREQASQMEFVFQHDPLREAAYATLTEQDRALGHRLAGAWLEGRGEGDALALGTHFEQGGRPARAAAWFRRGAEEALGGDDLDSALLLAERALACGAQGTARGALRLLQAEIHRWRDELNEAEVCASEAVRTLLEGRPEWFRAVAEMLSITGVTGRIDRVVPWVELLEEASAQGKDARRHRIMAACRGAWQLVSAGHHALADRLLALAEDVDREVEPLVFARHERSQAIRSLYRGEPAEAVRHITAAMEAFERAGDHRNACLEQMYRAQALIVLGAFERAEGDLGEALEAATAMHVGYLVAVGEHLFAASLLRGGDRERGRALAERAVAWFQDRAGPRLEGLARLTLAEILFADKALEAAQSQAARAEEVLRPFEPRRALALSLLAEIHMAKEELAQAQIPLAEALGILGRLGTLPEGEARIRIVQADWLDRSGRTGEAAAAAKAAETRLLERAARIEDAEQRSLFLHRAPEAGRVRKWVERLSVSAGEPTPSGSHELAE